MEMRVNEEDKLFWCGDEEGGCKKLVCMSFPWFKEKAIPTSFFALWTCRINIYPYLIFSFSDIQEDRNLDGRHTIEEAMSMFFFVLVFLPRIYLPFFKR